MKDQKEKIILKDDQPEKIEISAGNKTIVAVKGEAVEVPLADLQMWLNTGRFDWIEPETDNSDLPEGLPGRAALKAARIDLSLLSSKTREQLIEVPGIAAKTADAILEFLGKENGGDN